MMDDNAPLTITGLIATILSVIFAVAAMLNSRHRRLAARNAARAKKDESDEVDDRPYKIADPFTAAPFTPAAPAAAPPPLRQPRRPPLPALPPPPRGQPLRPSVSSTRTASKSPPPPPHRTTPTCGNKAALGGAGQKAYLIPPRIDN